MTEKKKPGPKPSGRISIHTRIDPIVQRDLQKYCARSGRTMGDILDSAIPEYLDENPLR